MGKTGNGELDQIEKKGISRESHKTVYLFFTLLFTAGIALCLYYIFDQTRNEVFWTVLFDYQKNLFDRHYSRNEFFQNTSTFDLIALTLYSKAVVATKGRNDKHKIGEILKTISQNNFKLTGEKGQWFDWLKNDLKNIQKSTFRLKIIDRPPKVSGRWLI